MVIGLAGSVYRRLDKRCDARSFGPPTDHMSARARTNAFSLSSSIIVTSYRMLSSLILILPFSQLPTRPRNHLLCTWFVTDCYSGILPFLYVHPPSISFFVYLSNHFYHFSLRGDNFQQTKNIYLLHPTSIWVNATEIQGRLSRNNDKA